MATFARGASIVSIEEFISARRATCAVRLTLMRFEEKEGKIELAEGLSQ